MPSGRPRKISSPDEMIELGNAFFDDCDAKKEPYTVTGLALALGLSSRESLAEYSRREEYSDCVKRLKARCENYAEKKALSTNGAGSIFVLKNYGWSDRTQTEICGPNGGPIQSEHRIVFVDPNGD